MTSGKMADMIIPLEVELNDGTKITADTDQHPRPGTSLESLASLKTPFRENGRVTAGNASGLNDGAAAVLLMNGKKARELGMAPAMRWVATAVAGVDPKIMGTAPVPAVLKALDKAGLSMDDMDIIELNEAFAVQALHNLTRLGLEPDDPRVNIWGGAIAFGHPLASSGPRLIAFIRSLFKEKPDAPLRTDRHVRGPGTGVCHDLGKSEVIAIKKGNHMSHTQAFDAFRSKIRDFVETELEPRSLEIELNEKIPEELVDRMRSLGLFGLSIPKEFQGLGLTTLEEVTIYEEITRTNACHRSRIGTSNGIGSMGILYDGTPEQKSTYLPGIAKGQWTTAFALTEADAGSDAGNISTTAELDGDHFILNGAKLFITNAGEADLFTVLAVTDAEKKARGGVTAFIVEKDRPGLHIGPSDIKMGLKGSHTHEVVFKECKVPVENIIGGMDAVGKGFKTAMRVLDKGRLSMGACALGASQKILEICLAHFAQGTVQAPDQAIQFDLADIAIRVYAARQMLYKAASTRDSGGSVTTEASMVKVFCTETASFAAERAMEMFGLAGGLTDQRLEMFFRDVRLYRIYEGTSEIQRKIIARNLMKQGI